MPVHVGQAALDAVVVEGQALVVHGEQVQRGGVKVVAVSGMLGGLEAQLAPKYRKPGRDDPAEPWSPNYGKGVSQPKPQMTAAEALQPGHMSEIVETEAGFHLVRREPQRRATGIHAPL